MTEKTYIPIPDMKDELFIELGDGSLWFPSRDNHEFYPEVIAASLSKLCRFTGHTRRFYSVAEHSVKVSYMVPPEFAFEGLMHDAHEMLTNDLSKPVKQYIGGSYEELEEKAEIEIRRHFGLSEEISPEVKLADVYACLIEGDELLVSRGKNWDYYAPYREMALEASRTNPYLRPSCWDPERGYDEFMRRFTELARQ